MGKAAVAGCDCVTNQQINSIVVDSGNDPLFVYYSLSTRKAEIRAAAGGSAQPILNKSAFGRLDILLPPSYEQHAIASILGALDDKIELNRRMNETLEAMAMAIFKDWFVDFGPTRAKAEGCAPYPAPEIWALFPARLDDEDKPEGWRCGLLQELVNFNPSEVLPKGTLAPYLEMAALPTSGPIPDQPVERAYSSGTKFRRGDTLVARITPCLENGKTAFLLNLSAGAVGWGSTEFIVMRPVPPVPNPYAYLVAREPDFRNHAIQSMTGTSGRQRVRTEALEQFVVAIPAAAVWRAFAELVDPMFEQIRANGDESQTLARTRDLLLPKLMSGEIRLRDAEKIIEAAA
jgi:type I restriction enzyme, S subunit